MFIDGILNIVQIIYSPPNIYKYNEIPTINPTCHFLKMKLTSDSKYIYEIAKDLE